MISIRLSLFFKLKKNIIPVDYHSTILSFFKKSFQENSEEMYNKYFPKDTPGSKEYCFAVFLGRCKFSKEDITLENNKLILNFSFYDEKELPDFINSFMKQQYKPFEMPLGNVMTLEYIDVKKVENIQGDIAVFKLETGLIVKSHQKRQKDYYFSYEEDGFLEQLKENLYFQIKDLNLGITKEDVEQIEFLEINMKKVVIKNFGIFMQGSLGTFGLRADSRILNYVYKAGIGSKKSSGMGYLKLLK